MPIADKRQITTRFQIVLVSNCPAVMQPGRILRRIALLAGRIEQQRADLWEARDDATVRRKMRAATGAWRHALAEVARLLERDGPPKQAPRSDALDARGR